MSDSDSTIPYGYCHCGCGQKARIATKDDTSTNRVKGQPMRFIHGHHAKRYWPARIFDYRQEQDLGHDTPCWIWPGEKTRSGYGFIGRSPRQMVHCAAWEQVNGPVPEGRELDHLCRQPPCYRPSHLEPVTHAENMRRGKSTKLTRAKVDEMKRRREEGFSLKELAVQFNLHWTYVSKVLNSKTWT